MRVQGRLPKLRVFTNTSHMKNDATGRSHITIFQGLGHGAPGVNQNDAPRGLAYTSNIVVRRDGALRVRFTTLVAVIISAADAVTQRFSSRGVSFSEASCQGWWWKCAA